MKKTTNKNLNTKRTSKKTYLAISNNIYHDGTSYRVRVQRDGNKMSYNFNSKRKAITYRNQLLGA